MARKLGKMKQAEKTLEGEDLHMAGIEVDLIKVQSSNTKAEKKIEGFVFDSHDEKEKKASLEKNLDVKSAPEIDTSSMPPEVQLLYENAKKAYDNHYAKYAEPNEPERAVYPELNSSGNAEIFAEHQALLAHKKAKDEATEKARLLREEEASNSRQNQGSDSAITIIESLPALAGASILKAGEGLCMASVAAYRDAMLNHRVNKLDTIGDSIQDAAKTMGTDWMSFSERIEGIAKKHGVQTSEVYKAISHPDMALSKKEREIASLKTDWDYLNEKGSETRSQIDGYNKAIKNYKSTMSSAIASAELAEDSETLERIQSKHQETMLKQNNEKAYPEKDDAGNPNDAQESLKKLGENISKAISRMIEKIKQSLSMSL